MAEDQKSVFGINFPYKLSNGMTITSIKIGKDKPIIGKPIVESKVSPELEKRVDELIECRLVTFDEEKELKREEFERESLKELIEKQSKQDKYYQEFYERQSKLNEEYRVPTPEEIKELFRKRVRSLVKPKV